MPELMLYDRLVFDDKAAVRKTADGYLTAKPRVARSGIQIYAGKEVGKPELDEVRVYRPESEVFAPDSLQSYAHRPVTVNHPKVPVTADNWLQFSRGQSGAEVLRDGDYVRVPMVLMDAKAIKQVDDGKKELSLGYMCDIDFKSGVSPKGELYDAIQSKIRANHIAAVDKARGGDQLRIGDEEGTKTCPKCKEEVPASATKCPDCGYQMKAGKHASDSKGELRMKTLIVDSVSIELEDDVKAGVIERALKDGEKTKSELEELRKKKATDDAAAATQITTKDAEIATLQTKLKDAELTPAKLNQLVLDRHQVTVKAKAVMDAVVVDDKTDAEIRRQVVDAKMGETAKGWSDEAVAASFAVLTKDVKTEASKASNVLDVAHIFSQKPATTNIRDAAYDEYEKNLREGKI